MNTNCPVTHGNLMAYRDGELTGLTRWRVARHVQHCATCRKEIEIMNQIAEELHSDERKQETEKLNTALRDRILTEAPARKETLARENGTPFDERAAQQPISKKPLVLSPLAWGSVGVIGVLFCAILFPVFTRSREYARRSTDMSRLPEVVFRAKSGSASDEVAPSGSAPAPAASFDRIARQERLDEAKARLSIREKQPNMGGSTATDNLPSAFRKVDKRADIAVEVEDVEQSGASVESLIVSAGGFVSNNTLSTGANGLKNASLSVRVPVGKFESILTQIAQLGEVKSKNVTGEDITERYSDAQQEDRVLSSELSVKEAQLQQALKREAASLRGKSERERVAFRSSVSWQQRAEVRDLRIRVAQARARLELLRRISALSSIEIVLQEKPSVPGQTGLLQEMGATGRDALASFLLAIRIPLNLLIWILAYAPIWLPLLLLYRYLSHRYGQAVTNGQAVPKG